MNSKSITAAWLREFRPLHGVLDAAEIARAKFFGYRRFRYFCGICWSRIKEGPHGQVEEY